MKYLIIFPKQIYKSIRNKKNAESKNIQKQLWRFATHLRFYNRASVITYKKNILFSTTLSTTVYTNIIYIAYTYFYIVKFVKKRKINQSTVFKKTLTNKCQLCCLHEIVQPSCIHTCNNFNWHIAKKKNYVYCEVTFENEYYLNKITFSAMLFKIIHVCY